METLWLIVGALCMGLGTAYFAYLGTRAPERGRYFYWITALVTLVALVSYLAMATGAGSTILGDGRRFYFFRYIDWLITTPLLLFVLVLLALTRPGRHVGLIAGLLGLDVFMVLTGLAAGASTSAFGTAVFFLISTASLIGVLYLLWTRLSAAARTRSSSVAGLFHRLALLTTVLWALYPIVFLLGTEGFRTVGRESEIFLFLVLDLLTKIGFGFLLLSNRQAIGEAAGGRGASTAARVR